MGTGLRPARRDPAGAGPDAAETALDAAGHGRVPGGGGGQAHGHGRGLGLAALTVTVLIWSSTFVVSHDVLTDMGPAALTFARFAIGLCVLLPFGIARGLTVRVLFSRAYMVYGLTGVALYYGLQNLGLRYTTPDSAALLQAGLPLLTVGLGVLWLGESFDRVQVVGLGLSVVGMVLVVQHGGGGVGQAGDVAILGGVGAYAVYTAYVRRTAVASDSAVTACASAVWGLVFLSPWFAGETVADGLRPIPWRAVLPLIYLGAVASGLTLLLWSFALRRVPASVAGAFTGAIPAAGYAVALLTGSPLVATRLVGGAVALAGVAVASMTRGSRGSRSSVDSRGGVDVSDVSDAGDV